MRTSGMLLAVMAAFGMAAVGCDKKPTTPATTDTTKKDGDGKKPDGGGAFKPDAWQAWASFEKGAWVEQETTSKWGDADATKAKTKIVVQTKSADEVKGDRGETKDQPLASKKVSDKCGVPGCDKKPADHCHMCDKKPADHKQAETKAAGEEEVAVGDKKLKCHVFETTSYNCAGEKQSVSKIWYNTEVPGWAVRSDVEMFGQMKGTMKTVTLGYGKQ